MRLRKQELTAKCRLRKQELTAKYKSDLEAEKAGVDCQVHFEFLAMTSISGTFKIWGARTTAKQIKLSGCLHSRMETIARQHVQHWASHVVRLT